MEDPSRRGKTGVAVETLKRDRDADLARRFPRPSTCTSTIARVSSTTAAKMIDTGNGHRLGDRGIVGVRDAPCSKAIVSDCLGQDVRARHLLATPFRADRSGRTNQRFTCPLNNPFARIKRSIEDHQFDAVGRSRAWLRIWLFARRTECSDALGSAVRRLRQWRAGRVRSIPRRRANASGCACRGS